jgi:hypothetical protein
MVEHRSTPSHSPTIERPACLICGTLMWLATVTPEGPDTDRRTFECPVCETAEIALVEFKPAENAENVATNSLIRSLYKAEEKRAAKFTVVPKGP